MPDRIDYEDQHNREQNERFVYMGLHSCGFCFAGPLICDEEFIFVMQSMGDMIHPVQN